MADDPMLDLFDSDPTSFLDELTGANPNPMAAQGHSMSMPSNNGGMIGLGGMQQMPGQSNSYMSSMQGHPQQTYSPMSAMAASPQYNTMSSQSSMLPQQYNNMGGYNQYGANSKLHHMTSSMVGAAGQPASLMGQSPPQQVPQQFGSPPPSSPRMQRSAVPSYQSYGMHGGPRMPSPAQQQMGIPQQSTNWNQSTATGQMSYLQQQQRQQQQQSMMGRGVPQMSNYLGQQQQQQHEYGMPNSQSMASRLSHFPDPANPNNPMVAGVMQGLGSPSGNMPTRLTHIPMSSPNSMNMLHTQPSVQQYPTTSQTNVNMNSYTSQAMQRMPGDFMQKGVQVVNSGGTPTTPAGASKLQHFGFQTSPQHQGMPQSTSRGDAPPLTHYPNQSPSQSSPLGQYQSYTSAGSRGPIPSPRPTPPPPSLTPTEMMTSPQGSLQQAGMQSFGGTNQSAVNPFQTRMSATPSPGSTMGMTSGPRQPSSMLPYQSVGFPPNSNMTLGVSTTMANTGIGVGQMSPSFRPHPQSGPAQDINVEIQQLQQQVKQLYSMPQTQQSQQTMLDLQERMRMLKAQQQQQILQIQQKQQKQRHQQQHQMMLMQQQQQQSSQIGGGQTAVMVAQPIRSPMSQAQISPTSPRKQVNSQLGLQTMASQVSITTLTSSQSTHQQLPPGGAPPPPQVPVSTSVLPHTPVLPTATPGLAAIASLSSPMASLVQLTDQQQLPTQQPFTQIHQQTSPILQPQLSLTPEQRSPSLALAASTPSGAIKPEPQPALDMPMSGQQPVLQSSPPQQSPVQTSPNTMSLHMSQIQPLQEMPSLPFHPQLQVHQTLGPQMEDENPAPVTLNVSGEGDLLNITTDQSPIKSSEATPEKKKKKRAKKKPVELGPDGLPLPKTPKTKGPKGPRKKKVKNQDKADQIVAEAIAKAQSVVTGPEETLEALPALVPSPGIPTPAIPTVVNEITEGTADETDTVNVTDISGSEPVEDADTETKQTPTPKKKKSKRESVPKEKREKKEKKPKTAKARPSKKKPPATFLKKKKKVGGGGGGSDVSDLDVTPPPSPQNEEESGIQKRRSARNTGTKRKKYLDELELNLSEEENPNVDVVTAEGGPATMDNPNEEDAVVVEKILGMRIRRRDKDEVPQIEGEEQVEEEEEEEEFYVKYKNFSYLHCEWRTTKELERDKRIQMKIKRYKMKRLALNNYFAEIDDEELFNPDYVEVDRVLEVSVTTDPVTEEEVTHFLVKWRSLAYDESTWELQQDVDPKKVEIFNKFKDPPPEDEREHKERPKKADEWKQLEKSPDYNNGNTLREYQLEGLNWLTFSWYNGRNCILADEMGLGKTIQSLTFSYEMFLYGIRGPFLVVAPLSTIANWQREYETWTDMNVITYHGSTPSRIMLQEYEMFFKDEDGRRIPDVYKFHVLITTYEIIIADCDILSQIDWRVAIIDEAHRLKNRNCQLLERLKLFRVDHRVLLTGTPLQNNVEELFSLLNFLEPKTFCSSQAFMAEFGDLRTESQVDKLKAILKPMMLRRLKEDVEKNLAPKTETIVEVELTNIQKKYYRAILERNFTFLSKGVGSSANVPNLMNTMMELRKCCNHPYLIKGAEDKILEEAREKHGNDIDHVFNALVQSCGKLVLIDKLLPKLQQDGHKILIFSQMIRVLDILEDYCVHRKYMYERLDGRIRGNIRQEAIDRFSKPDSDRFVFLLCTRAGGLGINLTAADTVIIFDSDWNPQNDLQAQARCHRIGQVRSVKVYRLITRNTYEREMFDKASKKLGLDKAVLQSMGGDKSAAQAGNTAMSKKEVEELLRKGAYGALMEDDNAGDKFCEEDIEQILQRRTQIVQIESEGKGSTFAKASFSAAGNRSDISIDDPNFWQKWAKKADLDVDELTNRNDLIIEEPRQRRQTTRYGNQDNVVDMSDLESSSDTDDENGGKKGKRGKKRRTHDPNDEDFEMTEESSEGRYSRAECFRVEKNLLVYGWGRWSDILTHGRFKRKLSEKDVETISRALLGYSLQFYKGDERIKGFIGDLVSPDNDAALKNHLGLSAPVPRGRKGKKLKKGDLKHAHSPSDMDIPVSQINFEDILTDTGYKRHLQRHSNKVLLRVRLLYYLKQEVIGNQAPKVFMGYPSCDIDIPQPSCDGDPPAYWWDEESDRSLLTGVFKHGYEKYNLMRQDPSLVFLSRCGPPDGAAVLAEQNDEENDDFLDGRGRDDEEDDDLLGSESIPMKTSNPVQPPEHFGEGGCLPFPSISELNTRLRRLITSYQRNHKKEQMKMEQKAKRMERREKTELVIKERELKKRESQQHRWSRREEADFYRTVSTFGVEMHKGRYMWDRFRALARLDKKYDHTLTEYFLAFYHMCKAVCKKFREDEDASHPNNIYVEPITEERAGRCLNRIDMLSRIRGEILSHSKLDDRLKLCQPSFDMPEWWICGKHDKDLLIGAARHGVARTDYHILHDPSLCFQEVIQCKTSQLYASKAGLRNSKPDTPSMKGEDDLDDDLSERPPPLLEREGSPVKIECKNEDKENLVESLGKDKFEEKIEVNSSPVKDEPDEAESLKMEPKSPELSDREAESMEIDEATPRKETMSSEEQKKYAKHESKSPTKEVVKSEDEKDISKVNGEVEESEKSSDMDGKLVIDMSINLSHKDDSQSASLSQESEAIEKNETPVDKSPEEVKPKEEKEAEVKEEVPEKEKPDLKPEIKPEKFEDMASSTPTYSQELSSLYGAGDESSLDILGKEATVAELLARSVHNSTIQWPKDKVIFNRLEHVCYAIDHGEWPIVKRSYLFAGGDSRSGTPVGASTPKSESLTGDHSLSDAPDSAVEGLKVNYDDDDDDEITRDITSVHVSQNDGLKMTFQKRRRRRKLEIEEERARLQQLMNQNTMSSDGESQGEILNFSSTPVSKRGHSSDKLVNGSGPKVDDSMLMAQVLAQAHAQAQAEAQARIHAAQAAAHAHALAQAQARHLGLEPMKKRRGRKRKADKIAELEAAARAAAMMDAERQVKRQAMEAAFSSEIRIPVINLEDGSRLSGKDAPRRHELEKWLDEHPGYMIDRPDMEEEYLQLHMQEALGRRRGRRPRVDPSKLTASSLTGEENVSVINRETGKKITGAKAPPLKYLAEWLQQNPMFDVDPKWGELVRAKGNLPKSMGSRVLVPSERRRRNKDYGYPTSLLGDFPFPMMSSIGGLSAASLASAGLMANFPKLPLNVPFGALPNLSMANPMLGLGGFGLPGISVSTAAAAAASMSEAVAAEEEKTKRHKSGDKDSKSPSKSSSAVTTPHPSFPIPMFNPLLYNPLFAAQGLRNFTLPPNLPTSFASLAQAGLSNGMLEPEQEEEGEVKQHEKDGQNEAQDLSVRHSRDKKTVREKLEELRSRQKHKDHQNREKKRSRVSDIVQDLTMKKCSTSPEKPEDLTTVKPKLPKPNRIIDKSNKSKVEGKLERLVAKLKAVDKTKSSPSPSSTATSSSSVPPQSDNPSTSVKTTVPDSDKTPSEKGTSDSSKTQESSDKATNSADKDNDSLKKDSEVTDNNKDNEEEDTVDDKSEENDQSESL